MNYNNSIILTFGKSRKGKFVIDRSLITGIFTAMERNYTTSTDEERTYIRVNADIAENIGINERAIVRSDKYIDVIVEEELKVVLTLVQGGKAAEVLFGQK